MSKKYLIAITFIIGLLFITTCQCQDKTIEHIGDVGQFATPATAITLLIIKKDKKGAWQFTKSYGTTFLVTQILKKVIRKSRPDKHWSYDSFPSGHTSSAFSGASFIQRRYGWKFGAPAYAVAAFTAYSRVHAKKHFTTDVLAGAAIGIGSTYIFTTPYQQEHYKLTFNNHNDSYLIGFTYTF